jgi:four helix bundle protein
VHDYQRLTVWTKARALAKGVYDASNAFPRTETLGLTAQMRRAAISIVANIAEGSGRVTNREFARFLGMSLGSSRELETEILIAADIGLLSEEVASDLFERSREISRMLRGLQRKLESSPDRTSHALP